MADVNAESERTDDEYDKFVMESICFFVLQHLTCSKSPPGPFSAGLKLVRDMHSRKQLIKWRPSNNPHGASRPFLLDRCLMFLAQNPEAEAVKGIFDHGIPDFLRRTLSELICTLRRMNFVNFQLFVRGSPTEICIRDCSQLLRRDLVLAFRDLDPQNLEVLQLDNCHHTYSPAMVVASALGRSSKTLPKLAAISLRRGSFSCTVGLKALMTLTPALKSVNLSQTSCLDYDCIKTLAKFLGSRLTELHINSCPKIDAMLILPELKNFEYLEKLSIAKNLSVSDEFVHGLLTACGYRMRELDFSKCFNLTDYPLKLIGDYCSALVSLDISYINDMTDYGLEYLADGCRNIQTLKLCQNKFSDEAIAAFVEASGESLKELWLGFFDSVGPCTAYSLATCSRKLLRLHLRWCFNITNEALGFIVDNCLSLKFVRVDNCMQITDVSVNGHSNPQVDIVGSQWQRPLLHKISSTLQQSDTLWRYSPLQEESDKKELKE